MMTRLSIDRLHSEFFVDRVESGAALERLTADVIDHLEAELLAASLPTFHAVCIPELRVQIDLDLATSASSLSRVWSQSLLDAVSAHIRSGNAPTIYPREIDVHRDVIESVASGDLSRLWAWHQIGVVSADVTAPTLEHAVRALAGVPLWIPAVLNQVRSTFEHFDSSAFVQLAVAMTAIQPSLTVSGTDWPADGPSESDSREVAANASVADLLHRIAGFIPHRIWSELTADQRILVGRLAVTCLAPQRSTDVGLIRAVVRRATLLTAPSESDARSTESRESAPPGGGTPTGRHDPADNPLTGHGDDHTPPVAGADPADRAEPPTEAEESGEQDPVADALGPDALDPDHPVTEVGGLAFLLHVIAALNPFDESDDALDPADVVTRALALLGDTALDEPLIASLRSKVEPTPDAVLAATNTHAALVAQRITSWVDERTDGDLSLADLVARRAVISAETGWIEITYPLDSIDLRVRTIGLDLDPGFVWWLGAVVRFLYV